MLGKASILPLKRDPSSRYLPWISAFMVYLAVLALAGVIAVDGAARRWEQGSVDRLTVQYIPSPEVSEEEDMERLLVLLRETPGVMEAKPLLREELIALIEPWLGEAAWSEDLPLPRLIDVAVDPGEPLDIEGLEARLSTQVPGAALDDPKRWLDALAHLARSVQAVASGIVLLVLTAAVGTVIVTTQMGLAAHREAIELLHLIGARDGYLARQFQHHALSLSLRGGVIGLGLAVATIFAIGGAARGLEAPLLPALTLESWGWGLLGSMPVVMALVVMMTARLTVLRSLARMP